MTQYRDHMTALNWPAAHSAASQYKDVTPADFLPFVETPDDCMSPLDRQAMEMSAKFAKLGV